MDWKKSTDTDGVTVLVRGKVRNSRLNGFEARSVEIQKAVIPEEFGTTTAETEACWQEMHFLLLTFFVSFGPLILRTSYDSSRKQHWLSVYRQKLAVQFLLKDHGRSMKTTNAHDSSRNKREIQLAVDRMVHAINQA